MKSAKDKNEDGFSALTRFILIGFGVFCFLIGIYGSFKTNNGLGFTTLIIVGTSAFIVLAIGRWPDDVNLSTGTLGFPKKPKKPSEHLVIEKINEGAIESAMSYRVENFQTIQPQLLASLESGEVYSYSEYDIQLQKSLRRKFPRSRLTREARLGTARADFQLVVDDVPLFIEIKFLRSQATKFQGGTLDSLIRNFPRGQRLLVIANVDDVRTAREKVLGALGSTLADVISWRGPEDNVQLWSTIERLTTLNQAIS